MVGNHIIEIGFKWPEVDNYKQFSDEYEGDNSIVFHGTSWDAYNCILGKGFKPIKKLASTSFANNSNLALEYAAKLPSGVIIAVKFDDINAVGIKNDNGIIHLYRHDLVKPNIIAFCRIPSDYVHC